MANKVAMVTGGGRGIGRAIVLRLAGDGFDMVVNSRQEQTVRAVVEEVTKLGRKALGIPADVSKSDLVRMMFDKALKEFGRLDVLVTNAGVTQVNTLDELTEEIWDRTMDVNAKGTFLCILEAAKQMIKQKSGRIIAIGSAFSVEAGIYHACYSASKFAVRGMTQAFAKELGPHGITVNCIAPGIIWTDMWKEADEKLSNIFGMRRGEAFEKFTQENVMLPESGKPEHIAPVVSFLASEGGGYITASTVSVGGGIPIV
ncbi:MAG: SDR family NAD(P)-dependent oxidoreductase [Desulfobacterales bacterium]|nr:MAG: SDR family NAD(P)-dependent oxidoreductase [Desulfobacterales bacterium]